LAISFWVLLCLATAAGLHIGPHPQTSATAAEGRPAAPLERVAFLACNLTPDNLVVLTANVAGSGDPGVVLVDAPRDRRYLKSFLEAYQPSGIIPIGPFPEGAGRIERDLGMNVPGVVDWRSGPPEALWKLLFPRAERVVVCPAEPRRLLLHAACLAGATRAPLVVLWGRADEDDELRRQLTEWGTRQVFAVGTAAASLREIPKVELHSLTDEQAVAAVCLRHQLKRGPIETLVVANPADTRPGLGSMSSLAPWVALQRRGVLLLTNDKGDNTDVVVRAALKNPALARVEHLTLVAGLKAIPMERRRNPLPGNDPFIELEPPAPHGNEPFTFATGRLFDRQPGVVALILARERLLAQATGARKALIVSNSGGGLPLLETISRNTAKELGNAGYDTRAMFQKVNATELRRLLPQQDLFLWEGHHSMLVSSFGMPSWPDPLRPSVVLLQSCLALTETEAHPFLYHGAVAVLGSGSRTYSASGGAFTLAFLDALLYENRSLGGSLRQAKNFLLAYAQLKEKRLGEAAKLSGASVRSAWAFTLWGDPTLKLPAPPVPKDALAVVRPHVQGDRIVLALPDTAYDRVASDRYQAQMWPNSRLAGYMTKQPDSGSKRLIALLFAEVPLTQAPEGKTPRLHSRVPADRWVFTWDARRRAGYLLVLPRSKDQGELRFQVEWTN
jgi:hypothetical protein